MVISYIYPGKDKTQDPTCGICAAAIGLCIDSIASGIAAIHSVLLPITRNNQVIPRKFFQIFHIALYLCFKAKLNYIGPTQVSVNVLCSACINWIKSGRNVEFYYNFFY